VLRHRPRAQHRPSVRKGVRCAHGCSSSYAGINQIKFAVPAVGSAVSARPKIPTTGLLRAPRSSVEYRHAALLRTATALRLAPRSAECAPALSRSLRTCRAAAGAPCARTCQQAARRACRASKANNCRFRQNKLSKGSLGICSPWHGPGAKYGVLEERQTQNGRLRSIRQTISMSGSAPVDDSLPLPQTLTKLRNTEGDIPPVALETA